MATEFIDKARISVSAGKGGNGAVAFHREKVHPQPAVPTAATAATAATSFCRWTIICPR